MQTEYANQEAEVWIQKESAKINSKEKGKAFCGGRD